MADTTDRKGRSLVRVAAVSVALGVLWLAGVQGIRLAAALFEPNVQLSSAPFAGGAGGDQDRLRFAVAGMVSAERTFSTYRHLVEKVSRQVGRGDAFILRPSYADVRRALEHGEVDVAMVCTGTYLHSLEAGRIRLLAQPEFLDGLEYRCAIIVPSDSHARSLGDLRGRALAFTDAESNTGFLAAGGALRAAGLDPDDFASTLWTGSHDRSIQAVAAGVVDAAAIDTLILHSMLQADRDLGQRVRVLWVSQPYGPPPVVVPAGLDAELEQSLREAFLSLHESPEGRAMLAELGIRRFVRPDPQAYEDARELLRQYRDLEGPRWR